MYVTYDHNIFWRKDLGVVFIVDFRVISYWYLRERSQGEISIA